MSDEQEFVGTIQFKNERIFVIKMLEIDKYLVFIFDESSYSPTISNIQNITRIHSLQKYFPGIPEYMIPSKFEINLMYVLKGTSNDLGLIIHNKNNFGLIYYFSNKTVINLNDTSIKEMISPFDLPNRAKVYSSVQPLTDYESFEQVKYKFFIDPLIKRWKVQLMIDESGIHWNASDSFFLMIGPDFAELNVYRHYLSLVWSPDEHLLQNYNAKQSMNLFQIPDWKWLHGFIYSSTGPKELRQIVHVFTDKHVYLFEQLESVLPMITLLLHNFDKNPKLLNYPMRFNTLRLNYSEYFICEPKYMTGYQASLIYEILLFNRPILNDEVSWKIKIIFIFIVLNVILAIMMICYGLYRFKKLPFFRNRKNDQNIISSTSIKKYLKDNQSFQSESTVNTKSTQDDNENNKNKLKIQIKIVNSQRSENKKNI